mgnify:CR=1 FL=1
MNHNRIEINKRLIGKPVKVLNNENEWFGTVVSVEDEETFSISDGEKVRSVDIFDIRSFNSLNLSMTVISSGGFLPSNNLSSILTNQTQIVNSGIYSLCDKNEDQNISFSECPKDFCAGNGTRHGEAIRPGSECECQCATDRPTYREDHNVCVNDLSSGENDEGA